MIRHWLLSVVFMSCLGTGIVDAHAQNVLCDDEFVNALKYNVVRVSASLPGSSNNRNGFGIIVNAKDNRYVALVPRHVISPGDEVYNLRVATFPGEEGEQLQSADATMMPMTQDQKWQSIALDGAFITFDLPFPIPFVKQSISPLFNDDFDMEARRAYSVVGIDRRWTRVSGDYQLAEYEDPQAPAGSRISAIGSPVIEGGQSGAPFIDGRGIVGIVLARAGRSLIGKLSNYRSFASELGVEWQLELSGRELVNPCAKPSYIRRVGIAIGALVIGALVVDSLSNSSDEEPVINAPSLLLIPTP